MTPTVDATCEIYAQLHNVTFGEPEPNLGGARTANLENGALLGIRAPLRETEAPVVRHYLLVDDIQATVDAAEKSGAVVAVPPMELPGHGFCAIIIHNDIETGFWQL